MAKNLDDEDSDLHDLLGNGGNITNGDTNGGLSRDEIEMTPLNLDTLSEGKLDVPVMKRRHADATVLDFGIAYCTYLCDKSPKCCLGSAILAVIIPAYFIIVAVLNPTEHFGVITNNYNDYEDITSIYDFNVKNIDHWCLKGGNDDCRCEDPLIPQSRGQFRTWTKAHDSNKETINSIIQDGKDINVAFLGESVIEEMDGRWMGDKTNDNLKKLSKIFLKNFNGKAVALGVAGDTNPSVLWRLLNGEMPNEFNPKIWWLQLGLNDLGRMQCSEEVVVLGILRIVEEILTKKPTAKVVINSLLPMPMLRGGAAVKRTDFQDSFANASARDRLRSPRPAQTASRPGGGGNGISPRPAQGGGRNNNHHHRNNLRQLRIHTTKDNDEGKHTTTSNKKHGKTMQVKQWNRDKNIDQKMFGKKPSPIMSSNTYTQKKFTPIVHRERRLPLWTSITTINKELEKFALNHPRVQYFDATNIFAEKDDGQGSWVLRTDLISFRGHPTEAGYKAWEMKIAEKVNVMVESL